MKRKTAKKTEPKGTAKTEAEAEAERLIEERRNEWRSEGFEKPYWSKQGRIWWWETPGIFGGMDFSFDKKKVYSLFTDYPDKLTPEERKIFEEECPGLARDFGGK